MLTENRIRGILEKRAGRYVHNFACDRAIGGRFRVYRELLRSGVFLDFRALGVDPASMREVLEPYWVVCLNEGMLRRKWRPDDFEQRTFYGDPDFLNFCKIYQIDYSGLVERATDAARRVNGECSFGPNYVVDLLNELSRKLVVLNLHADLREFLDAMFPLRTVFDWDGFRQSLPEEFSHGHQIIALITVLRCTDRNLLNGNVSAQEVWRDRLRLSDEAFASCYDAVHSVHIASVDVAVNGKISEAMKRYRENYTPYRQLLSDYYDVKRNKNSIEKASNQWLSLMRRSKKIPVESGVTAAETLFLFGAWKLRDEKPTDVIRSLFYRQERNVSAFECGFLYEKFTRFMPEFKVGTVDTQESVNQLLFPRVNVLIVNPSPDFILKVNADSRYQWVNVCFAVSEKMIAELYKLEFGDMQFVPFTEVEELKISFDYALIMSRDWPLNQVDEMMKCLSCCASWAQIFAVLPNLYFDRDPQKASEQLWDLECHVCALTALPTSITTQTTSRRKVLVHMTKLNNLLYFSRDHDIVLFAFEADSRTKAGANTLWFDQAPRHISYSDFYESGRTVKSNYRFADPNRVADADKVMRRNPEDYHFSNEIKIQYTMDSNRKGRFAGRAYYCSADVGPRRLRGKRLTERIEKGLRAGSESEVIARLEYVPFDERFCDVIVADILNFYEGRLDKLTLKTVWFCCRKSLLKNRNYDDELAKHIFCGETQAISNLVPAEAAESDYSEGLRRIFGNQDLLLFKYLRQLYLVMNVAATERLVKRNPLIEAMKEFSRQASAAQREVRNALAKKSFTQDEEKLIMMYITAMVPDSKGVKHKRYESDCTVLAGAIRFFTGMAIREVCALDWEDMRLIAGTDTYQFTVRKFVSEEGMVVTIPEEKNWKKLRLIPIASALAKMLLKRKAYLVRELGVPEAELNKMPIVIRENVNSRKMSLENCQHCKPSWVAKKCRKLIDAAQIPENILILPGEGRDMETDIYRYHGDIFQSNFRYRANHTCRFTRGEINYVLGIEPPDTFSRHYCDYTNDFVQYEMAKKLDRWRLCCLTQAKMNAEPMCKAVPLPTKSKLEFSPNEDGAVSADIEFDLPKGSHTMINLSIWAKHGYEGSIICYEEGLEDDL